MRLKSMAFALLYSNLTAGKGAENMFTEKIELKDIDKMDPEYKDLLGRVLTIQADCEIGGPHLYVEKMLPAAPTNSPPSATTSPRTNVVTGQPLIVLPS